MASCCAGARPSAPVKKESWLAFLTRPFVGKAEEEVPAATDSLEEPSLDSDQQAMTGGEWRRADRWGEGGVYAQAAKLVKLEDSDSLEQLKQLLPKLKELDRKEPQQGARDAVSSPKPKPEPKPKPHPEPQPEHRPEHQPEHQPKPKQARRCCSPPLWRATRRQRRCCSSRRPTST